MNQIISCFLVSYLLISCNYNASPNQKFGSENKRESTKNKLENVELEYSNLKPESILNEMTESDVIKNFGKNYNVSHPFLYDYGIDSEEKGVLVSKDSIPLFFVWSKFDTDSLFEIQILDNSIKVKPQVNVGMLVEEFLLHYPESKLYLDVVNEESEYFTIEEEFNYSLEIMTKPENRVGSYSNDSYQTEKIINTKKSIDKINIRKQKSD